MPRRRVQVQGATAERRDADVHLLRRITDVAWKSRWAHFVEVKDLHLADLRRQAEEHHRKLWHHRLEQESATRGRRHCVPCLACNKPSVPGYLYLSPHLFVI